MPTLAYFSSVSENTKRFVLKVGVEATAVALRGPQPEMDDTYVLMTPTYGGGDLPAQVERFLETGRNAELIRGVIGSGNTNFGEDYCKAGKVISARYSVPLLYCFELTGTPVDVDNVKRGLRLFYAQMDAAPGAADAP